MGLEEDIRNIKQEVFEIRQALQLIKDPSQMVAEVQSSLQNLFLGISNLENGLASIQQIFDASKISSELQDSIQNLPLVITNLEESIGSFQKTFETTAEETKNDLKFIKVSYVEDVVGSMRKLSDEISNIVNTSSEEIRGRFEASVNNFVVISDKLNDIESDLNALIENQTDQLATVAELRDRVNAIIQVELASLRDRIAIYLESSVNELKTSVTERLGTQDSTLQKLTKVTGQLTQNIAALPEVIKQQIDTAIETRVTAELASMKKEMKKMTALIIQATKRSS